MGKPVDTISAPDQHTMVGNALDGAAASGSAALAPKLGEKASDYTGCWYMCGGVCLYRMCPCGDSCIHACCCCCGMPLCMCYFKEDGQWKGACEDRGGKKIIYMVDEKTIRQKTSTAAKDHAWGQMGAQCADGKDVKLCGYTLDLKKLC